MQSRRGAQESSSGSFNIGPAVPLRVQRAASSTAVARETARTPMTAVFAPMNPVTAEDKMFIPPATPWLGWPVASAQYTTS